MKEKIVNKSCKSCAAGAGAPVNRPASKKDQLIKLLGGKNGVELKVLSTKLGWLPHTTRAAVSRLRTAGHEISLEKNTKGAAARYMIVAKPRSATAKQEGSVDGA